MSQVQAKIKWDDAAYVKLFLTILSVQEISVDYEKVSQAMGLKKNVLVQSMFKLRKRAKDLGIEATSNGSGSGGTLGDTKGRGRKKGSATSSPAKKRKTQARSADDDVEASFEGPGNEEAFDDMDANDGQVPVLGFDDVATSNHTSEPATPITTGQTVLSGRIQKPTASAVEPKLLGTHQQTYGNGPFSSGMAGQSIKNEPRPSEMVDDQEDEHQDHDDQGFDDYSAVNVKCEPRSLDSAEDDYAEDDAPRYENYEQVGYDIDIGGY